MSPVGSCPRWAVVTVGICRQWAVVHGGQLSPVGSCPRWAVVASGQLSHGAAVGWADVGASLSLINLIKTFRVSIDRLNNLPIIFHFHILWQESITQLP